MKPRQRLMQLEHAKRPIICNSGGRSCNGVPVPEAQQFCKGSKWSSAQNRVLKRVPLQLESQAFVTFSTENAGLIVIEREENFFDSNLCLVGTGIARVSQNTYFQILIAKVGNNPPNPYHLTDLFNRGRTSFFENGVCNNPWWSTRRSSRTTLSQKTLQRKSWRTNQLVFSKEHETHFR